MRTLPLLLVLAAGSAQALEGTLLLTDQQHLETGDIVTVDCGSGERTVVRSGGDMFGPGFSPDGAQIAFWRAGVDGGPGVISVMNVDGSDVRELCTTFHGELRSQVLSWAADGHIYWSERGQQLYRVSVASGEVEIAYQTDHSIVTPSLSLDATRAVMNVPRDRYYTVGVDMLTGTELELDIGCWASISPDGALFVRNIDHRTAYVSRFDDGSLYATVTAPRDDSDLSEPRFSRASGDYLVFTDATRDAYVVNIHTDERLCHAAGQGWDFYPASQPEPTMLLLPATLEFEALSGTLGPPPQQVSVTGLGALNPVETSVVFHQGSG